MSNATRLARFGLASAAVLVLACQDWSDTQSPHAVLNLSARTGFERWNGSVCRRM